MNLTSIIYLALLNVLFFGLLATFILSVLNKTRLLEKYELYRLIWMPEGSCFFCLSWWLIMPINLTLFAITGQIEFLLGQLIVPVIAKNLV